MVVDAMSSVSVPFLDFRISKEMLWRCTGILDVRPEWKPHSRGAALGLNSAHTREARTAWPGAELDRIAMLSSSNDIFLQAKAVL